MSARPSPSTTSNRFLRRGVTVFTSCALLGGALASAAPALAYVRHIDAFACMPLDQPVALASDLGLRNQYGSATFLGFYCPFTYDTAFLPSQVSTLRVDINDTGTGSQVSACYTANDGSSSGCGTTTFTTGSGGAYSAPTASTTLWKQDPNKTSGSRYDFVAVWIGGGNSLNGVYASN